MSELAALLISPLNIPRPKAIAFINSLKQSPYVEIIHINIETDTKAWQLFSQRPDKNWSLVDCSSFIVMNRCQIAKALTSDRHFEQAGFVGLLK